MAIQLIDEINATKRRLVELGGRVEKALADAIVALERRDVELGRQVVEDDAEIDRLEVELEEECLKVLALHQPVASDLRWIVAVLKINGDLERIGDLAANMGGMALEMVHEHDERLLAHILLIAEKVQAMLRWTIDSLVQLDINKAREVLAGDDEIDDLHRQTFSMVEAAIQEDAGAGIERLRYLSVSRYLERIADHANNVAEDVIYLTSGDIIRHLGGDEDPTS